MIGDFKARISEKIRQKDIALVMIADRGGHIRWHHGRPVKGKTVQKGLGFSRTHLLEVLAGGGTLMQKDVVIGSEELSFPESARILYVKSLFIHPIDEDLILYVDSGNDAFDPADIEFFKDNGTALKNILSELKSIEEREGGITGDSPATQSIRQLVLSFALEEDPVLILGETGVGKSHIAQLIHRFSGREGQFIVIDTPAIPETLFESELFGHARGAFTGAVRDKTGLVEVAEGGTLFLDEIAEVPVAFQAKLLRFMDTHRFRAVGDTRERNVAVRIIAATNRNLEEEIVRERFREDLFYRLNVLTIDIPALRERKDDIRALVHEHERFLRGKRLGDGFWDVVLDYDWPGNVREVINVMKRVGIQFAGPEIGSEVEQLLQRRTSRGSGAENSASVDPFKAAIAAGKSFWDTAWPAFIDREISRRELRAFLSDYFAESQHNLKQTAHRLNIKDTEYPRFVSTLHKYRVHPGQ